MDLKANEKANLYDQYVSSLTQLFIAFCFLVESTEITAELYHFTFARKSTRFLRFFYLSIYIFRG